jgi:hypothetical protein
VGFQAAIVKVLPQGFHDDGLYSQPPEKRRGALRIGFIERQQCPFYKNWSRPAR